ncbi:MAG: nuclear transport factor 2 family protein [Candidatus Eremiobacteraeota bacterium]|nr:nuclear transport factor 2 family protein [Candidatus Eremiobacteraeota bacterium]MBV8366276.1 nuclear transport factor 2 family protein [Candidatus Eremiobacteraeota bacterium]
MLRTLLVAACILVMTPAAAFAAQSHNVTVDPGVFIPIKAFADSFNAAWQGGPTTMPDIFTDDISVIDLFPPFYWHGKSDVVRWYSMIMPSKGDRALHQHVELGSPFIVTVGAGERRSTTGSGDTAYVVVPATLTYVYNGKQQITKAVYAWTLRHEAGRWRVCAHSWGTISETQPHAVRYTISVPWARPAGEQTR